MFFQSFILLLVILPGVVFRWILPTLFYSERKHGFANKARIKYYQKFRNIDIKKSISFYKTWAYFFVAWKCSILSTYALICREICKFHDHVWIRHLKIPLNWLSYRWSFPMCISLNGRNERLYYRLHAVYLCIP